jgi:transcriptional regulator with XRE-family HTH domain
MPKIPKTMDLSQIIAQKIRTYREGAGLTQKELGLKLGYKNENAQAQIYQYESGIRSPGKKRLEQIAVILEQPIELFVCEPDTLYRSASAEKPKSQPTEFDKELALFAEEAKKYGPEGVRTAREMLAVIFKKKKSL